MSSFKDSTSSEAELLQICGALLTQSGLLWWRNPVQASLYTRGGKTFMRPSPIKGFPDLSFVGNNGRLYCAELKAKKGRTSAEQIAWLEDLNLAGARACVIRTPKEMSDFIAEAKGGLLGYT